MARIEPPLTSSRRISPPLQEANHTVSPAEIFVPPGEILPDFDAPKPSQIKTWILGGRLYEQLPADFDQRAKGEKKTFHAAVVERQTLENRAIWLGFIVGAVVGVLIFILMNSWLYPSGAAIFIGAILVPITATIGYNAGPACLADNQIYRTHPFATTESIIVGVLEDLNTDEEILRRAVEHGFVSKNMVDNRHTIQRAHVAISRHGSNASMASRQIADRKQKGLDTAGWESDLSRNQTEVQRNAAIVAASGNMNFPDMEKCRSKFKIDRHGKVPFVG